MRSRGLSQNVSSNFSGLPESATVSRNVSPLQKRRLRDTRQKTDVDLLDPEASMTQLDQFDQ
jgi:hypothetical protein